MYDQMTRAERLQAPSYEEETAGVSISAAAIELGAEATTVVPDHEVRILDEEGTRRLAKPRPLLVTLATATAALALDPLRRGGRRTVTGDSFSVGPTTWQTADAVTGVALDEAGTYRHALAARSRALAADASARGAQRAAPTHALVGT
jgi:hypothetical protein